MARRDTDIQELILSSEDRFWQLDDLKELTPEPDDTSRRQQQARLLQSLCVQGELVRIRRGLYWRPRPTIVGPSRPTFDQVLRQVVGKDVVIAASGVYAANLLGFSTQVPPRATLALSCRIPTGLEGINHCGNVLLDRRSRRRRQEQQLSDLEASLLEMLECWTRCSDLGESGTITRFKRILAMKEAGVRIEKLTAALPTEPQVISERLRLII